MVTENLQTVGQSKKERIVTQVGHFLQVARKKDPVPPLGHPAGVYASSYEDFQIHMTAPGAGPSLHMCFAGGSVFTRTVPRWHLVEIDLTTRRSGRKDGGGGFGASVEPTLGVFPAVGCQAGCFLGCLDSFGDGVNT